MTFSFRLRSRSTPLAFVGAGWLALLAACSTPATTPDAAVDATGTDATGTDATGTDAGGTDVPAGIDATGTDVPAGTDTVGTDATGTDVRLAPMSLRTVTGTTRSAWQPR